MLANKSFYFFGVSINGTQLRYPCLSPQELDVQLLS